MQSSILYTIRIHQPLPFSTSLQAMFSHDVEAQLVPRKSPLAPLPSCKEQSLSSILRAPLLPLGTTLPLSGSTLRTPETPGADARGAEPLFPEPSTFGSFLLPDSHPQTPNRSRSKWATSGLTSRAGFRPEQKPLISPFGHYVCSDIAISEVLFRWRDPSSVPISHLPIPVPFFLRAVLPCPYQRSTSGSRDSKLR